MDAVNLLPAEYRARKRGRSRTDELNGRVWLQAGALVALVLAVLMAGLYLHERSTVHGKQRHLADSQARLTAMQAQVDAVKSAQAAIAGRVALARGITQTRMNWDRALGDFARVIPTNSYLTSLQISAPATVAPAADTSSTTTTTTPAPSPSASALMISGVAPSVPGVALVMDRLTLLPWLSNVTLGSATRQADGTNTFSITAGVSQER